jgi:hypothetical protein
MQFVEQLRNTPNGVLRSVRQIAFYLNLALEILNDFIV